MLRSMNRNPGMMRSKITDRVAVLLLMQYLLLMPIASVLGADEDELLESAPRMFSLAPILPGWLASLTGHAEVNAEELIIGENELRNIRLPIRIENRVIMVDGDSTALAAGKVSLSFRQDQVQMHTTLTLRGEGMAAATMAAFVMHEISAPFDFELEINGNGLSPHDIAATAQGFLFIDVGAGVIANDDINRAGKNLFALIVAGINPFGKDDKSTRFRCAMARLHVVDGKVATTRLLGLQTDDIEIVCGGTLDFDAEAISLQCRPLMHASLGSGSAALLKSIAVTGPFLQPEFEVDTVGLLQQGASFGVGITSINLTNIAGLLRGATDDACDLSLD
ncbi:MAG: hypothetical protein E2O36_01180 [Proteobacteria bacterium]|nr:MAG: hypothetical protein E2O36_01180 [Pseudomonadota bacterium]